MSATDRVDRWLLEAGFDPDPDTWLAGRAADELSDSDDGDAPDPWADRVRVVGLDAGQRAYIDATSPDLGGGLPAQLLGGGDPFVDLDPDALRAADDVIDLDE